MQNIGYKLADNSRLLRRLFDERMRAMGVTGPQARLLLMLARDGGHNQGFYAEELEVEPITLCRMVDRLEDAELVQRQRDPKDRRAWQIHLTDKAQTQVAELRQGVDKLMEDALSGISEDDREIFAGFLDVMGRNLGAKRTLQEASNG